MIPQVTVLMSVYNGEKFLLEAMDSILNQTFKDFEFLIINDGSTDRSEEIINSYSDSRINLVNNQHNLGLISSLNKGIKLAKGKYIARMDADDISTINRLKEEFDFLEKNEKVVLVGSNAEILDVEGNFLKNQKMPTSDMSIRKMMLVANAFFHGSILARKEAMINAGMYRIMAPVAEDYDLWSRMMDLGKLANIDQELYKYRVNPGGESLKKRLIQQKSTKQINDYLWTKETLTKSDWKYIWPRNRSNLDTNNKRFYQYLHVQFAKKFRERWNLGESVAHIIGAASWLPLTLSPYFYVLLWLMPFKLFCKIEEYLLYNLFLKKNYQER